MPDGLRRRKPQAQAPIFDPEDKPKPPIPTRSQRIASTVASVTASASAGAQRVIAPLADMASSTPLGREIVHAATHSDDQRAANSSRTSLATHLAHKVGIPLIPALPDPVHILRRAKESVGHLSEMVQHVSHGNSALAAESAARASLSALDASTGTGLMPFGVGEVTHVAVKLAEHRAKAVVKRAIGKQD